MYPYIEMSLKDWIPVLVMYFAVFIGTWACLKIKIRR